MALGLSYGEAISQRATRASWARLGAAVFGYTSQDGTLVTSPQPSMASAVQGACWAHRLVTSTVAKDTPGALAIR